MRCLALLLFVSVAACGESPKRGTSCEAVGRAACVKALQCNQTFTAEDLCTASFVGDCCEDDGTCDDKDPVLVADDCVTQIDEAACSAFDSAMLPATCAPYF